MLKFQRIIKRECIVLNKSLSICGARYNWNSLRNNYSTNHESNPTYSSVADYYAGKSVFLTGGTGFLGKLFIERLLYNCTDLDKIYMLIREKKGVPIHDRINELFQNPVFTKLKLEKPHTLKKVIPVAGDVSLPDLGITPKDHQTLKDEVSVVFHSAATVSFTELLPFTMNINYEGTRRIHNLCKQMNKMEVLVFLSTAYSQTMYDTLEEKVYPPPADINDVYKFIEKYGNDRKATMKFIDGRPNAYTMSKAFAESFIAKNHHDVPSIIIRPSIISPINEEPLKGWLDNWFGATKYLYDVANGWTRVVVYNDGCLLDLIPVDYVCNTSIVAAARFNRSAEPEVYNCCTSSENPLLAFDCCKYIIKRNVEMKRNDLPFPSLIKAYSEPHKKIVTLVISTIPAYVADTCLRIMGKKRKFVKMQTIAAMVRDSLEFFANHVWVMKADKVRALKATLSSADQRKFPFDPKNIQWEQYMRTYCDGIYKYLRSKM